MDTKILEKLIKDHLGIPADKFFNEDYKEENLQAVAEQCTRLESELKAVREQKGKSAFFDRFEDVLNDLSFKSGHPEISDRDHEMARHAATAIYLQRSAFWSDIVEAHRLGGEEVFKRHQEKARRKVEEWKVKYQLRLESGDKELISNLRNQFLEAYEKMAEGQSPVYTLAKQEELIEELAFLDFKYRSGQSRFKAIQFWRLPESMALYFMSEFLNSFLTPEGHEEANRLNTWADILMHPESYKEKIQELLPRSDHSHHTMHSVALADALVKKGILKGGVTADNAARTIARLYFDKELPRQLGDRARSATNYKKHNKKYFDNL